MPSPLPGSWPALTAQHYAAATIDAIGVGLAALTAAGSVYIVAGLARRTAAIGLRWSAGRPARRLLAVLAAAAIAPRSRPCGPARGSSGTGSGPIGDRPETPPRVVL